MLTNGLARIAVPLFFFFSGFLFFYRSEFTVKSFVQKVKKRVKTLLVPYLFWNIIVWLFLVFQGYISSLISGGEVLENYNFVDFLKLFWDYNNGMPVCYQFWFIRDLMIAILFSPVFYFLIKYMKIYGVLLLGVLWCLNIWFDTVSFSIASFFFFAFGAWFSINNRNFVVCFDSLRKISTLIYVLIVILDTILWRADVSDSFFVQNIGIFVGLIMVVCWTSYGLRINNLKCSPFWSGSSFFIYAFHGMFMSILCRYWMKLVQPTTDLSVIIGYLFIPILIISISVVLYALLLRVCPRFLSVITGMR